MKEEGRGGGSELGSVLDLDADPWKILWIWIQQNDTGPLDLDQQHCFKESKGEESTVQTSFPELYAKNIYG